MQHYNETWYVGLTHATFVDCSKTVASTEIMVTTDRTRGDMSRIEMRTLVDSPSIKPKQKFNVR